MAHVGKFTRLVVESKISTINDTLDLLDDHGAHKRELFVDLLQAVFGNFLNLNTRLLADDMGLSHNAVSRWIIGRSAPNPILFDKIVGWVRQALMKERDNLRQQLAG